ncbi:TPA: DUF551 domain-containing protein [Enterobacter hormaechei]|nr:DUF551 domain-containing protein [Enterobacter hormaechei]
MSTTLKEWLVKTITELEEERDAVPGAVNEDAAMALAAMKMALGALEAEESIPEELEETRCDGIRKCIAALRYHHKRAETCSNGYTGSTLEDDTLKSINFLKSTNTAPALVSVPDDVSVPLAHAYKELTPTFMRNHIDIFERYGIYPDGSAGIQAMRIALDGMNRRAAMLQGADGNSPVIPGGWVACSERMPETMVSVLVTGTWFHHAVAFWDGLFWCDLDFEQPVTHWMPLPAAPQQGDSFNVLVIVLYR